MSGEDEVLAIVRDLNERERANSLGGQLAVELTPGAGTRLIADLPLGNPLERREKARSI